jgi:hypothetical protein
VVDSSLAVTVTGSTLVADINIINTDTATGVVTATATETAAATLVTLNTTATDMITVTMAGVSTAAADLNTIDGKTGVAVGAAAVTTITGTATDVAAAYAANTAGTISGLGDEAVTITGTSATAIELNNINTATSGAIDATALTSVTGSSAAIDAMFNDTAITFAGTTVLDASNDTHMITTPQFANLVASAAVLDVSDTILLFEAGIGLNAGTLTNYGGSGTIYVGYLQNGEYTVNMGTSGNTLIVLDGNGNHTVTAGTAAELFSLTANQNGGSTLLNLGAGDAITDAGATLVAGQQQVSFAQVAVAGDWAFDDTSALLDGTSGTLSYIDGGVLVSLTLTSTLDMNASTVSGNQFIV